MNKKLFAPFSYSSRLLTNFEIEKLEKSIRSWMEFLTQEGVALKKESFYIPSPREDRPSQASSQMEHH